MKTDLPKPPAMLPDLDRLRLVAFAVPELKLADHAAGIDYANLRRLCLSGVAQLIAKMEGGAQ